MTSEGLSEDTRAQLTKASTATLAAQLLRRGLRNTFMSGVRQLRPGLRLVGTAYTLRYVPAREDLWVGRDFDNRTNPQRIAVEQIGPSQVLVIDARGDLRAGSFGQILATRIHRRGAAGLVTDGGLRDTSDLLELNLPIYFGGPNPQLSTVVHHPVDVQVPIACGGVLVMPADVIVGDEAGVVVIPRGLAEEVAAAAIAQERLEAFLLRKVEEGSSILDLYPPDSATLAEFRAEEEVRRAASAERA